MITWQEGMFFVGAILFSVVLVPSVLSDEEKPPFSTCLMTTILLGAFSVAYLTIDLYFAGVGSIINGSLWAVLTVQRLRRWLDHIPGTVERLEKHIQELRRGLR